MNTSNLKKYAPKARLDFINAVTSKLNLLGISADKKGTIQLQDAQVNGDLLLVGSQKFSAQIKQPREKLISRCQELGVNQIIEQVAYTWFNRLCAIRYMELHDYIDHGVRVLSHPTQPKGFEILDKAAEVAEELELPKAEVIELKLAGTQDEALYQKLLLAQCHQLHQAMPFLFEALDDETELLLPDNLTRTDSLIRRLVDEIPEEDWAQVEVFGWLYQFYISEKKDQVIGKVVKSEDIPAATQLFTPNWIVQYLVQNSIGRQWMLTYPDSPLKDSMPYFIPVAEQPEEAQQALSALIPESINPEALKVLDPACGSGHILVEAYNTLYQIYEERGYRAREIPALILNHNLYGLDLDDRAAQLAGFALVMRARQDDRRIFSRDIALNILALQSTESQNIAELWRNLNLNQTAQDINDMFEEQIIDENEAGYALFKRTLQAFVDAKTLGSLIEIPSSDVAELQTLYQTLKGLVESRDPRQKEAANQLLPLIHQAVLLAQKYDCVIANPPYMGKLSKLSVLDKFTKKEYPNSKSDLFAVFVERGLRWLEPQGFNAMVTMQSWMFLSSYEKMRASILNCNTILSMAHLGTRAFDSIGGEVVSTTAFVLQKAHLPDYKGTYFRLVDGKSEQEKAEMFQQAVS